MGLDAKGRQNTRRTNGVATSVATRLVAAFLKGKLTREGAKEKASLKNFKKWQSTETWLICFAIVVGCDNLRESWGRFGEFF
jgi:hypothetical protein